MQDKKQTIVSVIVLIIVAGLIWGFASFNTEKEVVDESMEVFAKCVADKGLTMYGAEWCGHCANERKAFGDAFKFISYVECPENIQLCTEKQINGYPTWIDGAGQKYEGAIGIKGIAQVSGCPLPQ
jgi:hypothetical protein